MKTIATTCFLLIMLYANANSASTKRDTLFLKRSIAKRPSKDYHAIYIDKNRQSKTHGRLLDFSFSKYENLDECSAVFAEKKARFRHLNTLGLPVEWVPLYSYKSKYYVYSPSEAGWLMRKIINDSAVIYWYMDGPMSFHLDSVSKKDKSTWQIHATNHCYSQAAMGEREIVNIYMIDPVRKIAVWEFKKATDKAFTYQLYVAKEKVRDFDIVVNDSPYNKAHEFEFDEIDFAALLRRKQFR